MQKYLISALVAATAVATPALAQDAAPFTGLRAEGIVGWDRAQYDIVNGFDIKDNGVVYGFGLGYDAQLGGAVAGLEAEISDSTTKKCISSLDVVGDRACVKAGRDLYVGGRVGTVVGGSTLLYAKAGYTNARFNATYRDGGTGVDNFSDHTNLDGIRLGAGAEYAVGPNSFVKAEYRYSNYEQDVSRHQVVAGFGFRF
jgi:outer membrane immunogenic protein